MALPAFTMSQLLEAGVHFGHREHSWEPKMAPYIYGARGGIHIIDLSRTVPLLYRALEQVKRIAAGGGRILFVGTKRQASQPIAEAAQRCAQYYMNHRWLGGTLTNWETISKSIGRLRELEEVLEKAHDSGLTKKELHKLTRERDKHERALGGIRNMGGLPDLIFVVDIRREVIAVQEARKLGVPIVAVVDSNCDPDDVDHPIPGNDDAARAVRLYCDLVADAVLDGMGEATAIAGPPNGFAVSEAPAESEIAAADGVDQEPADAGETAGGEGSDVARPDDAGGERVEGDTERADEQIDEPARDDGAAGDEEAGSVSAGASS